jgi:hypothetical protein
MSTSTIIFIDSTNSKIVINLGMKPVRGGKPLRDKINTIRAIDTYTVFGLSEFNCLMEFKLKCLRHKNKGVISNE